MSRIDPSCTLEVPPPSSVDITSPGTSSAQSEHGNKVDHLAEQVRVLQAQPEEARRGQSASATENIAAPS
ncbi:hypothetical protein B0H10DRAFT_1985826 [Mycena sp. CBHHK59/15]|nr:hypothetical protein B0H10DRAFT_1985826 [Mycena sp. CBHHK59/15]